MQCTVSARAVPASLPFAVLRIRSKGRRWRGGPTFSWSPCRRSKTPGTAPLTVLAFARADDEPAAEAVAVADLEGLGWSDIAVQRIGALVDWDALPDDFKGAVDTAVRFGCGLIIYDEP